MQTLSNKFIKIQKLVTRLAKYKKILANKSETYNKCCNSLLGPKVPLYT